LPIEQKVIGDLQSSGDEKRDIDQARVGKHEPDKHRRDGGSDGSRHARDAGRGRSLFGMNDGHRVGLPRWNVHLANAEPLRACLGDDLPAAPLSNALNGPADLYLETHKNSQGRNFMFELIMGARLAKAGITPSFDKGPDLQFQFDGLRAAIQCKRPLTVEGLESTIGSAISQLKKDTADL
jgi:hypothetical protein